MDITVDSNNRLLDALNNAGLLPAHCLEFRLSVSKDRPATITTTVYATSEQLDGIKMVVKEKLLHVK